MIIKSMSRPNLTFADLIEYIEEGATSKHFACYHNTYSRNAEDLTREFKDNARFIRARKDGIFMYHEILSIKRTEHLSLEEQKERLFHIARSYLEARAPHQLGFGMIHDEHDEHLHFHFILSSNVIEQAKKARLSKKDFRDIQTHLERHVLTHYPELHQKAVFYNNLTPEQKEAKQSKARISQKGAELKRRTGNTPKRDEVKATLGAIFSTSTTPQAFTESMNQAGFTFYQRGKHAGIADRDGNKYRFASLGIAEQWATFDATMRANMSQHHTPKNAESSVSVQSDTATAKATDTTQHTPKDRVLRETVIGGMVAETLDSMKDLLNDATDFNAWEAEQQCRLKQMQERREQQAKDCQTHQHGQGYKPKP